MANFSLSFDGGMADRSQIDLYDVGQAIIGFQRSLALTTHLVLNDEIITQAPSLRGATILTSPASEGSWKITATIIAALYTIGTAPRDTPLGHLISSAYDYVINETLGFHVDYNKTLGEQFEEFNMKPLSQSRFDSLTEKCETAVRDMHRPIAKSKSAEFASVVANINGRTKPIGPSLNIQTYDYITHTIKSELPESFLGYVSSYNVNTFRGRVFILSEGRPIPFELSESTRTPRNISIITNSLRLNAQRDGEGEFEFTAFENTSRSGRLKSLNIVEILR